MGELSDWAVIPMDIAFPVVLHLRFSWLIEVLCHKSQHRIQSVHKTRGFCSGQIQIKEPMCLARIEQSL